MLCEFLITLPVTCALHGDLHDEECMRQCISYATVAGIVATGLLACHTGPLSHRHILAVCRGLRCCGALKSLSLPWRTALSYRSSFHPPPHPSITQSAHPAGAGTEWYLWRNPAEGPGPKLRVPFPLWPPALAALPLLVIVRGVLGRQWAIQ